MSPRPPTPLQQPPLPSPSGWQCSRFPLSKLDLAKLAGDSLRKSTASKSARFSIEEPVPTSFDGVFRSSRTARRTSKVHVTSRSRSSWSWFKFKKTTSHDHSKGELAHALVREIWSAKIPPDLAGSDGERKRFVLDPVMEINKIQASNKQRRQQQENIKEADSLMDILLQNWSYFEHMHGNMKGMEKHVHAKYCENEFSHFLLKGNQHIHAQFYVHLHFLIPELRTLLTKLKSQILTTRFQTLQELPVWNAPELEEPPELKIPPMPPLPQLYPIEGLQSVPTEQDHFIPHDLEPPIFKPPTPKNYPFLVLPEPIQVPPLELPVMPTLVEDESTIDYESYKEDLLPTFVPPNQDPLPVWVEPQLAELPQEPEYLVSEILPPPILKPIPSFRIPLMDPRPCEKSYYELERDERGICDGLCSKHGRKHYFVPGSERREPCFASPPPLLPLPSPPLPGAESANLSIEHVQELLEKNVFHIGVSDPLFASGLPISPELSFEKPIEEPLPVFNMPILQEEPPYMPPAPPKMRSWKEPNPPYPLGWLAGQSPIFLIDCSAAMRGGRMEAVQNCLEQMFNPGGQVHIAATHFDIIMYSFDAWSYGDMENSYIYKQSMESRYVKPLEPMRLKTADALESALRWVTKWRPNGTSNLWKALTVAISRSSADCVYLFSEGKADKPVLILEFLRKQAELQGGDLIPIHTVSLSTSKPKCRFLKKLSAVTGGSFIEYDFRQRQDPQDADPEEMEDMMWAKEMVEVEQRKNAEIGRRENIEDIMQRVESQYEPLRVVPRLHDYKEKCEEYERFYHREVQAIRKENVEKTIREKQLHEQLVAETMERNRVNLQKAEDEWRQEIENVRRNNKLVLERYLKWKCDLEQTKKQNERTLNEAKRRFALDLNKVEARNAAIMEEEKLKYASEVNVIKRKNQDALETVARKQKEIDEKIAAINKSFRDEYEAAVEAINASNAELLSRTRQQYEEQVEWVERQNSKAMQEAEDDFVRRSEDVRKENARKKTALAQKLEDIKRRREESIAAHEENVAKAIAHHEQTVKEINALNSENEVKARLRWRNLCDEIDKENDELYAKAKKDFEEEQIFVQKVNIENAEKRLLLQRSIMEAVRSNEEIMKWKKLEWKRVCDEIEFAYQKLVSEMKEHHERAVEEVKLRNAERLQASLLDHKAKVAAVQSYNETVRPYVDAANALRAEINRIESFFQCIADSVLPPNRHASTKTPAKPPLDSDLDLLTASRVTLSSHILIKALKNAYGKSMETEEKRESKGTSMKTSSVFNSEQESSIEMSLLTMVHVPRALSHRCYHSELK